jgi:hypothetical protein
MLVPLLLASAALSSAPPEQRVIVVPGCPTAEDGSLGACLASRVVWAAELYEQGQAHWIITSGGAAYTPWVEAEAMAAGLEALGVPPGRIWLDPYALHTDENMWNARAIARSRGWEHLLVASHGAHARGARAYLASYGASAEAAPMDLDRVQARLEQLGPTLDSVRVPAVPGWRDLAQQELERAARIGGEPRASSWWLYTRDALRDVLGLEPIPPYQHPKLGQAGPWSEHPSRRAAQP